MRTEIVRRFYFSLLALGCFVSVAVSRMEIALAQGGCETITQDHSQSKTIYESAFSGLKIQTLEVCPTATVNGVLQYQYYEVESARSGNFGTCFLVKNSLYAVKKSENSVHLSRSEPRGEHRRQDIFMAMQKRPCGSLDRGEYIWTDGITEGVFVTIARRLSELREGSIVDFLRSHGTTKFIHELETDGISDLIEESDIARQKNFIWKLKSISLNRNPLDNVTPLYRLDFRGPTGMWSMTIDFVDGKPTIYDFRRLFY